MGVIKRSRSDNICVEIAIAKIYPQEGGNRIFRAPDRILIRFSACDRKKLDFCTQRHISPQPWRGVEASADLTFRSPTFRSSPQPETHGEGGNFIFRHEHQHGCTYGQTCNTGRLSCACSNALISWQRSWHSTLNYYISKARPDDLPSQQRFL